MNEQQSLMELSAKVSRDARETSRLAAMKVAPKSGTARRRVLETVVRAGKRGVTDDELSELLQMSPNSVRPRRLELVEGDWVCEGSREATSFYGNKAIAWIATPKGVLLVEAVANAD